MSHPGTDARLPFVDAPRGAAFQEVRAACLRRTADARHCPHFLSSVVKQLRMFGTNRSEKPAMKPHTIAAAFAGASESVMSLFFISDRMSLWVILD
jgi:hypothetical protein